MFTAHAQDVAEAEGDLGSATQAGFAAISPSPSPLTIWSNGHASRWTLRAGRSQPGRRSHAAEAARALRPRWRRCEAVEDSEWALFRDREVRHASCTGGKAGASISSGQTTERGELVTIGRFIDRGAGWKLGLPSNPSV